MTLRVLSRDVELVGTAMRPTFGTPEDVDRRRLPPPGLVAAMRPAFVTPRTSPARSCRACPGCRNEAGVHDSGGPRDAARGVGVPATATRPTW
jgi:hypothetical protein